MQQKAGNGTHTKHLAKISLLVITALLYGFGFVSFYHIAGNAAASVGLIPVAMAGFFYGKKIGLLAGALSIPVNALLFSVVGSFDTSFHLLVSLPPVIITILSGLFTGWLSELLKRNKRYTLQLEQEHSLLKEEIEKRKLAERALFQSKDDYRMLVENVKEVIFKTTAEGQWAFLNPAWTEITGFAVEESLGFPFLNYIHPDDAKRCSEMFQSVMERKKEFCRHEIRCMKNNGSYCWVEVFARLAMNTEGEIQGVTGTLMDITARKETEHKLRMLNDKLEQRVAESALQLETNKLRSQATETELQYRFTFEQLISQLSENFIDIPVRRIDEEMNRALRVIGKFTGIDKAYVFQIAEDGKSISNTHGWSAEKGIDVLDFKDHPIEFFPWLRKEVARFEPINITSVADLPDEASVEREFFLQQGVQSLIIVPMKYDKTSIGSLVFESVQRSKEWSPNDVLFLKMAAEIFANALIRQRTELKIQSTEQQLRQVLAASNCFVYSCKVEAGFPFTFVSDNVKSILGYDSTEIIATQKLGTNNIHRDDKALWFSTMRKIFKHEEVSIEYRLRHQNGSYRWMYDTIKLRRNAEGKPIEIVGTVIDITERKTAEEKLREHEELLHSVLNTIPQYVFWKDKNSVYMGCNENYARSAGYQSPEQIIGKTDFDLPWNKADAERYRERDRRIMETDTPEIRIVETKQMADGKKAWIETSKVPMHNAKGNVIGILGTYQDITDRIRAEQALKDSEELYRLMFQSIPYPMWVYDIETHAILTVNDTAIIHYGYSREEFLSMSVDALKAEKKHTNGQAHSENEPLQKNVEAKHKRKDGTLLDVEVSSYLMMFNGRKARFVLVNDVTEKKRLEKQLFRAQRMESIGTLAGGIAHDLNNILTPVMMWLEVLKEKLPDEKSQNILSLLESSTQRGSDMVRQVLMFARGVEGERVELQAVHILKEIKKLIVDSFPKSIEISLDFPADLWRILGDATQLQQVLMNLCVNARDAMPHGGTLSINCENVEIDEGYSHVHIDAKPGYYVMISVADSGIGISQNILHRIFDPFFTTKEVGKGTGLGLSTSMAIVKAHDGFINVYSEEGKGSVFKVYLPAVVNSNDEHRGASRKAELPRGKGELVLVIDDEAVIREVMKEILTQFGYTVITASDGTEAISLYVQRQADVKIVITDMMMPYMDGIATIRALRQINPAIKIIGTSGLAQNETALETMKLQVQGFVRKPFTAKGLLETLVAALNNGTVKSNGIALSELTESEHTNGVIH